MTLREELLKIQEEVRATYAKRKEAGAAQLSTKADNKIVQNQAAKINQLKFLLSYRSFEAIISFVCRCFQGNGAGSTEEASASS